MKIVLDIKCGNHVVEQAEVTIIDKVIVDVTLLSGKYQLLNARSVNNMVEFWRSDYITQGDDEYSIISRAINTLLYPVEPVDVDEDSWIDAAYEDRYAAISYFE